MSPKSKRIFYSTLIIAAVNFALFFLIALAIGGDAVNGKTEGGKYYLANHGKYTEVSPVLYWYSFIHVITVLCTHVAALVVGLALGSSARRGEANR